MSGTRVIYHLEHQETPYLLHVPAQHVTLADLKQVLNKQNHKFFFKSVDDDFGWCPRRTDGFGPRLTAPVGSVTPDLRLSMARLRTCSAPLAETRLRVAARRHLLERVGLTLWTANRRPRRTRQKGSVGAAPQPKWSDGSEGAIGERRRRTWRRYTLTHTHARALVRTSAPKHSPARLPLRSEPARAKRSSQVRQNTGTQLLSPDSASDSQSESLSSLTDSSMSLTVVTVTLDMEKHRFLGISIVGQSSERGHGGVCVGSIMKGGAAAADARVEPGDMLLQVNDVSLENTSNEEAVRILREALRQPSPLTLTVAKCWGASPAGGFSLPRSEPVRPIDPAAWVSHTAAMSGRLLPHYSVHEDVRLTVHSDMEAVVRSMADPESGVDVRDRLWLKITIPHAFIGSDVVDWLLRSVDGFVDRRDARKYAATLLSSGYIRHAVNKLAFSEQCYYVFGNACTDASSTHHEEVSCHSGVPSLAAAAAAWEGAAERGDSAPSSGSSCSNNQPAGGRAGGKPRQEADAANGEDATPPPTFSSVPQQPFRLAVGKSGDCSVDVM
ncbi:segment polarity protein dishevelled homolog DVL-3-like isoform X1 [Synchiropus splendidus]|uniref:segment polarity protein dishevelled homolog DVL-3-like isoform X1 n=1 Tax=Synchiropus splendidus TaxID=270530 RepID=UPI00237D8274|nr:segment polarity protein dishevelled homolog DVL-3-like isoform X1 [Synchiropus splendidus]